MEPGFFMSCQRRTSAQFIMNICTTKRVLGEAMYPSHRGASYQLGRGPSTKGLPMISGAAMPVTPSIAQRACMSSACWYQASASLSSPRFRGSKPKSPGMVPSRCLGGVVPGK